MLNNVTIMGRLTNDIELRNAGEQKVANFSIACQRSANREKTDFIPVVAWGKIAEVLAEYIKKGQRVILSGQIQSRKNKDGKEFLELLATSFEFVEGKKE